MVRSSSESVSDEAVVAATGRPAAEWFALLDGAGVASKGHPAIVARLAESGVAPWWAQSLAVRYEQARGLRLPGQQSDGSFAASVSKRLPGLLEVGYRHVVARFTDALGAEPASSRSDGSRPFARWSAEEGSILVTVEVAGVGKLRVTATHERMSDPAGVDPAKERLRGILSALAK